MFDFFGAPLATPRTHIASIPIELCPFVVVSHGVPAHQAQVVAQHLAAGVVQNRAVEAFPDALEVCTPQRPSMCHGQTTRRISEQCQHSREAGRQTGRQADRQAPRTGRRQRRDESCRENRSPPARVSVVFDATVTHPSPISLRPDRQDWRVKTNRAQRVQISTPIPSARHV